METDLPSSIKSIKKCLLEANNNFTEGRDWEQGVFNEPHCLMEWYIEQAFVEILVLTESLGLLETHRQISDIFRSAKEKGLGFSVMGVEDPYPLWASKIGMYLDGIAISYGQRDRRSSNMKNLKEIIKRSEYVICDLGVFGKVPENESDVHNRVEAILKCYYKGVKSKPSITKPIKNFEPDIGVTSIKTLIEFKFVTSKTEAKRIVDEIFADASGYKSLQWRNILYVIYESRRIHAESDWKDLLKDCKLDASHDVVVLQGEPSSRAGGTPSHE